MKIFKYYKSILICIFVLLLSLFPADSTQKIALNIPHLDKLIHFLMYFFLTSVILIDIKNNIKKPTRVLIVSVLFCILILSGCIEFIQEYYIFGRFGSLFDLTANLIGITSATFLFYKTSIFSKFDQYF